MLFFAKKFMNFNKICSYRKTDLFRIKEKCPNVNPTVTCLIETASRIPAVNKVRRLVVTVLFYQT